MDTIKMPEEINTDRRRFFGAAAVTVAAAQLGMIGSAAAQSGETKPASLPAVKPGTNTSFGPTEADRCRRPECRLRRGRSRRRSSSHSAARLALRHSQLCRCRPFAGLGRLPGDRSVPARLWHDAISFERNGPQRPAVGARRRSQGLSGRSQDREADPRRLRLGSADRQHLRGALAGALQGHGLGERLSDRQPGSRQDAVAAEGRARNGGISSISPRNAAAPATKNTGASLRS